MKKRRRLDHSRCRASDAAAAESRGAAGAASRRARRLISRGRRHARPVDARRSLLLVLRRFRRATGADATASRRVDSTSGPLGAMPVATADAADFAERRFESCCRRGIGTISQAGLLLTARVCARRQAAARRSEAPRLGGRPPGRRLIADWLLAPAAYYLRRQRRSPRPRVSADGLPMTIRDVYATPNLRHRQALARPA